MTRARWSFALMLLVPLALASEASQDSGMWLADAPIAKADPFQQAVDAKPASPSAPDPTRAIASAVVGALQHGHYAPPPIDDALSARWFDRHLESLDPNRLYFTADDLEALTRTHRLTLDDDILAPRPTLEAPWRIHHLFVRRVGERIDHALALLARVTANPDDPAFDFDNPDRAFDLDRSDTPWPDRAGLDAVWQDRVAEQLLRMELSGEERDRAIERLTKRFERIRTDVQSMEDLDILETWLGSLARTFDPHSSWFKPISKENFDIEMADKLTGIGARLQLDEGYTTIAELIAGGPAEKGGTLQAGDRIVAVAQKGEEPVDVVDMRLDRVVQLIRGKKGTVVELTVHPADAADPSHTRVIAITRDEVKIADAAASGSVELHEGKRIGIIDVPSFYIDSDGKRRGGEYGSTANDTKAILEDFKAQKVDAVVLDLRRNAGGALDQALETTGLFLPGGPVVQVRDRAGEIQELVDPSPSVTWEGPLVVLVSEASASASEILAAAIQDHRRGLVVGGAQTHGKGTVQNLLGLGRYLRRVGESEASEIGGALKYTTHMFYRVDGASTQVEGVKPDIELPSVYAGLDINEGDLDNPLPWHAIAPAGYTPQPFDVDVGALAARSRERVSQSMEFAFLLEDLMRREAHKDDDVISLHRSARQAEIERLELIVEARKTAREMAGTDPEDPPDAILREATAIAADLVRQRHG